MYVSPSQDLFIDYASKIYVLFINIRDTKYDLASSGVIVCAYQDIDLSSKTEISAFFVSIGFLS